MEGQPHNDIEQPALTELPVAEQQRFKTLGVRIEESTHAQLSFIAQLSGNTLADEIKGAIDARLLAAQDDAELIARAEAVQAEMQREAEAKRQAIAGFFGRTAVAESVEQPAGTKRTTARRKPATDTPEAS